MGWIRRMCAHFRKEELESDFAEELQFHISMREQRNVEQGMSKAEAHRSARVRFGNLTLLRERMRAIDLMILPQTVMQDVRFGGRMLLRNAGFTAMAVFALAVGIGMNTAAFTAYKAFFERKLDAHDPGSMVNLGLILHTGATEPLFSYPDYETYRDQVHSFSGVIAASMPQMLTVVTPGGIVVRHDDGLGSFIGELGLFADINNRETAMTMIVSENYFSVLGVAALRGRTFGPADTAQLAASPSVLISENYWQKRFKGDPAILGKTVKLNNSMFTIIGVTPHNFVGTFIAAPDFWLPLSLEPRVHPADNWLRERESGRCHLFARLAPGAGMRQAQAEMSLVADHLRSLHNSRSDLAQPVSAMVRPGSPFPIPFEQNRGLRTCILFLIAAFGMVLVVACANVASLQLARAASRQNELSMRLSLGASRSRLIRQLLTESTLLAMLAGVLAFLFSWVFLQATVVWIANVFPDEFGTFVFHVTPDVTAFSFVFLISVFAGILFGLAPALESSRSAVSSALKANAGTSPMRSRHLRNFLIATQVAVSAVLVIAGSMLIHGAIRALWMDTGYDDAHVIDLNLQFPEGPGYTPERKTVLLRDLRTRLSAMPGVVDVTTARAPDDQDFRSAAVSLNETQPSQQNAKAYLFYTWIEPNYFQTLGIPMLFGRGFTARDGEAEPSVVLSESAANLLWPGQNALGRTLRLGTGGLFHTDGEPLPDGPVWRVIGVARDVRGVLFDGSDSAQIYLPLPNNYLQSYPTLVRTRSDPAQLVAALAPMITAIDPNLAARAPTLKQMLRGTEPFIASTMAAAVASTTGILGLLLATIGIYGTVSYIVVLRTREVGIRMALGAKKRDILTLILGESTRPVFAGLSAGVVLAAGVAYLLRHVLYGIHIIDTISFGGVSLLFLAVALLAALIPSQRALRVEPVVALRYE
jgi:macrolide transport system ATP-binding/permease protein